LQKPYHTANRTKCSHFMGSSINSRINEEIGTILKINSLKACTHLKTVVAPSLGGPLLALETLDDYRTFRLPRDRPRPPTVRFPVTSHSTVIHIFQTRPAPTSTARTHLGSLQHAQHSGSPSMSGQEVIIVQEADFVPLFKGLEKLDLGPPEEAHAHRGETGGHHHSQHLRLGIIRNNHINLRLCWVRFIVVRSLHH
jgi:hypothetical protein